jgi:predicted nucleic acid-binding protein
VIVVSDTSPINNLAAINQLALLQQLYGTIVIPEAVYRELTAPDFPVAGSIEIQTFDWIETRTITDRTIVYAFSNELDIGEAEAIALAIEIKAEQLLIDERRGRAIAERLNLRYIGILGVLVEAKNRGMIPEIKPLLNALINQAGFWISATLYNSVLQFVGESD